MEHLSGKPYYLTDEDILWVGTTLADMMPVECADAEAVKRAVNEGYATMIRCDKTNNDALAFYQRCIEAGVLYAHVPDGIYNEMTQILRDRLNFNGMIIRNETLIRDNFIQVLGLQAALGLHNK